MIVIRDISGGKSLDVGLEGSDHAFAEYAEGYKSFGWSTGLEPRELYNTTEKILGLMGARYLVFTDDNEPSPVASLPDMAVDDFRHVSAEYNNTDMRVIWERAIADQDDVQIGIVAKTETPDIAAIGRLIGETGTLAVGTSVVRIQIVIGEFLNI